MLVSRSVEILEKAVQDINRLKTDLVVHCGDLTDDSREESFQRAKYVLDELECPCYVVPGNHDTYLRESRSTMMKTSQLRRLYYSIELDCFHLLFLDVAYWKLKDGRTSEYIDWNSWASLIVPEEEMRWIDRELATHSDMMCIVVLHCPLVFKESYQVSRLPQGKPVEKRPVMLEDFKSAVSNRRELLSLLDRHTNIRAVFAGDTHFHDINVRNRVLHCTTGALVSYPNEFRLIDLSKDGIKVTTLPLSNREFSRQSYVEEWGNRWVRGSEADRDYCLRF